MGSIIGIGNGILFTILPGSGTPPSPPQFLITETGFLPAPDDQIVTEAGVNMIEE
tara:strand:+ start:128 stop:292 length:165 start_codon:yes stop_codon:yes gene_type:complete